MKQYIQFYKENNLGQIVEALASDGYKPLDGRLSINTIINDEKLLKNFRNYTLFEIRKVIGNNPFEDYITIYSNINKKELTYNDIANAWTKVCYYHKSFNRWAKDTYNLNQRQLNNLKAKDK